MDLGPSVFRDRAPGETCCASLPRQIRCTDNVSRDFMCMTDGEEAESEHMIEVFPSDDSFSSLSSPPPLLLNPEAASVDSAQNQSRLIIR